jgi:heterodisulfide reductase subunit A-like polyferredoxin
MGTGESVEVNGLRPGLVMCVCTGKCPGFAQMDIWDFINRARVELPVEFAVIHPQLCEEDGDRYLADALQAKRPLVIAGCAPNMQYKLFRDAFAERGMDVKRDMRPVDVRDMTTEAAVEKVATALREMGVKEDA